MGARFGGRILQQAILRYVDGTTLCSANDLRLLVERVKKETENSELYPNIEKMEVMRSNDIGSGSNDIGSFKMEEMKQLKWWDFLIFLGSIFIECNHFRLLVV